MAWTRTTKPRQARTRVRRPAVVPIHPEPIAGRPRLMDWVLPAGTFDTAGPVLDAPGEFGTMLAEGPVSCAIVQPGGGQLLVELRPGVHWRDVGARVRTALHAALTEPRGWRIGDAADTASTDQLLREAAIALLAGDLGDYVRSHGGDVELLDVTAGVVSIVFHGSCHGCPAANITAHARFERELRARCPILVSVRSS
ncbi:MAG TPA: NifU family protein [Pseudonocardiaceae bacterium]